MRRPPRRENLLAEAQPAMSEPRTPTPMTARTKKMPASMTSPTAPSLGPIGMARRTSRYGRRATAGASWKIRRSAPAGTMSSFCANFTPSATSWAQPWKPPAYIGPRRPCMWAITLCSVWPMSRGKVRKTTKTIRSRRATSSASFTAGLLRGLCGSGRPGDSGGSGFRRWSLRGLRAWLRGRTGRASPGSLTVTRPGPRSGPRSGPRPRSAARPRPSARPRSSAWARTGAAARPRVVA